MDYDAPEREVLNLEETVTILCVSLRRMGRAFKKMRDLKAFDNAMVLVSPLLDGDLEIEH